MHDLGSVLLAGATFASLFAMHRSVKARVMVSAGWLVVGFALMIFG